MTLFVKSCITISGEQSKLSLLVGKNLKCWDSISKWNFELLILSPPGAVPPCMKFDPWSWPFRLYLWHLIVFIGNKMPVAICIISHVFCFCKWVKWMHFPIWLSFQYVIRRIDQINDFYACVYMWRYQGP